ncbi:hypothetical protein H4K35_06335 [Myroides sp. NP-2]|uniref:hypothetical protein n=1 Tax=Myroides sp. NP-2 TaxID=2759945 RepID=UPI0015FB1C2F|nr:hypothetical protein [Myroides sp. NP-2]MBB1149752.1 hypothetical protein [Myroides sp. NP-2]
MNYIKHLNSWFEIIKTKTEATPTHIALYVMLFHLWNQHRFAPSFGINRQHMVNLCKIGSNSTYSKCMRELNAWGWIIYKPTKSKYGVSEVSIVPYQQLLKQQLSTAAGLEANNATTAVPAPSSTPSSRPSSDPRTKQAAGHLLKQQKEKEENQNQSTTHLKNKFNEPL